MKYKLSKIYRIYRIDATRRQQHFFFGFVKKFYLFFQRETSGSNKHKIDIRILKWIIRISQFLN